MKTTKAERTKELYDWLDKNKIKYSVVDPDVIEIPELGKAYFQDTQRSDYRSILKKDKDGNLEFNSVELEEVLENEGIEYIVFKFGVNFYYYNIKKDFALNILKYVGERQPCANQTEYVNLGVHTPFELLNGSFMLNMWVKKALWLGHRALGICDKNTMAACFQLQKECEATEIKPVFGYTLTCDYLDGRFEAKVYVLSQTGYRNLLRIQKAIMVDNVEEKIISLDELCERGEGNVLVIGKLHPQIIGTPVCEALVKSFDKVYYQVDLSEYKAERIDIRVLEATKHYFDTHYEKKGTPRPILISDCYYLDKDDAKNKVILNKIAEGAAHEQSDDQYFKDIDEQYALFEQLFDAEKRDVPKLFAECCEPTVWIAENATARMDTTRNFMPKYDMTREEKEKYGTTHNMFNRLLEEGLQRLAPEGKMEQYRRQMEYEKYIIESTDNVDYLLVQYDTCNWARRNGILVGCGRGSAAGSLLLYLLGITLIDPIKYDLIFERFLLPERAGLSQADTTIIGEDIDSLDYIEVTLENTQTLKIDKDAQLLVKRTEDEPIIIYADALQEGDDIIFDNKDLLFTLNEIQK